jgi:hypothetical protein
MAIDTSGMLLKLNPLSSIDLGGLQSAQNAMQQREQLRLQREQFEAAKANNARELDLRKMEEQGRNARAGMEKEQAAQTAKAAKLKQRHEAYAEFTKLNGEGNVEAARAMVPFMTSLGMKVDLEDEQAGLPRYTISATPEDDPRQLDPVNPLASAEEQQAAAARTPSNVLDMGARQQRIGAQLDPVMNSLVSAYPAEFQGSARDTSAAVRGLNLSAEKTVEMFDKMRGSPDQLIKAGIDADAAKAAAGVKSDSAEWNTGFEQGNTIATKLKLGDTVGRRSDLGMVVEILGNGNNLDDYLAGAAISRLMGERGATTEGDIGRALGNAGMSFIDKVKANLHGQAVGGLTPDQKKTLLGVAKNRLALDAQEIHAFMDNVERGDATPGVVSGRKAYRDMLIPRDVREGYEKLRKEKQAKSAPKPAESGRFDMQANPEPEARPSPLKEDDFDGELRRQSEEQGLNFDAIKGVIGPESGGKPGAVNSTSGATGLIQFLPSVAKAMGTTTEEIGKMSATEQIPLVLRYFKERGLTKEHTQDDYYLGVSAPAAIGKPDDTVVYKKGSVEWEQNPAWRPAGGGDITVGDIKAYGGAKRKGGDDEAKRARLEELRAKKAGG